MISSVLATAVYPWLRTSVRQTSGMTLKDSTDESIPALTAKEFSQVLREVTLGRRVMTNAGIQGRDEVYACDLKVEVERWQITL